MAGNPTPHPKRPAADPIAKLEKSGGAVWALRRGQGPLFELRYARRHGADVVVEGTIHAESLGPEGAVDAADAERLFALAVDDLRLIGWKPDSSGIFKRTWILRSDLDRSALRRTVEQSIASLARCAEPSRPPIGWSTVRPARKTPATPRSAAFSPSPRSSLGTSSADS